MRDGVLLPLIDKRLKVGVTLWYDILFRIRASYGDDRESEGAILNRYVEPDRLIIEDLGVTTGKGNSESDFSTRTLWWILEQRIYKGRPTYFTSNKNPYEILGSFDDRVYSRICGHCHQIEVQGKDRRQ